MGPRHRQNVAAPVSLPGLPITSTPIGRPSSLHAAATASAGRPEFALRPQLVPLCASPIRAGFRRSVG